ncbi:nucleoside hydrolase [Desertihabitans aurantiacus]|uniref:nucleoside hydrolase n=1 Tax=Desertihabitans aurantiacus TaxID=2282477 RepID=UPI000DF72EFB|nr:nucleoside hydrolase [Desertihabitans aurantiacus]
MQQAATPAPTRRRVVLNTDAKNEADDQFAIVHALLSPTLDVRGLVAAHFGIRRSDRSMLDSRDEIDHLLRLTGLEGTVPVANGAAEPIPDEATPQDSPGARLILEESMRASWDDPLYVAFLGPLTDMASAILLDPAVVEREVVVIWIGGDAHDGRDAVSKTEFNLSNDIAAANVVFDSGMQIWQVPRSVYRMVSVSYAELDEEIGDAGPLGAYLIRQLHEWNARWHGAPIESRSLGDSPAVALMLYPGSGSFRTVPAPRFGAEGHYVPGSGHPIRVCEAVDVRFLMADMFAKIRRYAATTREGAS